MNTTYRFSIRLFAVSTHRLSEPGFHSQAGRGGLIQGPLLDRARIWASRTRWPGCSINSVMR